MSWLVIAALAVIAWLVVLAFTLGLLTAAKRGDEMIERTRRESDNGRAW